MSEGIAASSPATTAGEIAERSHLGLHLFLRWAGAVIDLIVLILFVVVPDYLLGNETYRATIAIWLAAITLYFPVGEAFWGRTVGKLLTGTIVVDTPNKFLFLVQGNGKALRYGIGVGRPGFTWSGVKTISAKKEWPAWTPPPEMLARRPDLPRHMEGGPENPLGARAMYLGSSLYRIHGSNEPWTIGTNVSSGCIRMRNEDVIDLYGRVNVGAKVVVI